MIQTFDTFRNMNVTFWILYLDKFAIFNYEIHNNMI